jgi:hypothetical protein
LQKLHISDYKNCDYEGIERAREREREREGEQGFMLTNNVSVAELSGKSKRSCMYIYQTKQIWS